MILIDTRELKKHIYENRYAEQLLLSIGCHSVKYNNSNEYWTAANKTGDNKNAIILYDNEWLNCINFTRQMTKSNRNTDIIDLVAYTLDLNFPQAINYICNEIGISYYHDFKEDVPESFRILDMIASMSSGEIAEKDKPLKPIDEEILNYYKPYVNDLFKIDGISYSVQKEFEIGYDQFTNRITIPIRDEIGNLVGVKGRLFKENLDENDVKYLYIEPCNKSKVLYGLYKTLPYIKAQNCVYVFESEKAVLQAVSYGYENVVATGGKTISQSQIDMLTRLGVNIIICFDKDVDKKEIEDISCNFIDNIPIYYVYDEDNILSEKESPSDNKEKWELLIKNNIYKIK